MSIDFECFQIADTEIARARPEHIPKRQGSESCVSARAPSTNDQAVPICLSPFHQEECSIHAIIHVGDSPLPIQRLPVRPAIAGTATIVHICNGEPAAGPVLNPEVENRRSRG